MKQYLVRQSGRRKPGYEGKTLPRRIDSILEQLEALYGAKDFEQRAQKFHAMELIHSEESEKRVLGLLRLVRQDSSISNPPGVSEISRLVNRLEERVVDLFAKRAVQEKLQVRIQEKMEQKYNEYLNEIKLEVLKEQGVSCENVQTFKKLTLLEKMEHTGLNRSALDTLRPSELQEIVGQEKAVKALLSKLNTPFPQHILLYGPPGVGKTTCARLAMEMAKQRQGSVFKDDAPFVEVDGTTLRWDARESTNPLLGSVHDPIYQGARRELAEEGIPEPKLGLVSEAHGGILFIDEIGEMEPYLQNKLLKVLEDKRVFFDSSYYDPNDERIPQYIKKIFEEGVASDFVLIGATTREKEEISPAFRSRCLEVFFEPLSPDNICQIISKSTEKLGIEATSQVGKIISEYCTDGRTANKILVDAYSLALADSVQEQAIVVTGQHVYEAIQNSRITPSVITKAASGAEIGKIFGVGVSGHIGRLIEIESIAFPMLKEEGTIRFNDTAGSMAKDSVANAASVFRKEYNESLSHYDIHINIIGGGKVDGPSAGAAIYLAICSAVHKRPIRQDVAISGEISIQGRVKPVGGIYQKILGAKQAGIQKMIIPADNSKDVPSGIQDITIVPIRFIEEAYSHIFTQE